MIRRMRIGDRETWTTVGVAVIAAPVVVSYVLWLWTMVRLLVAGGRAVAEWVLLLAP